LCRADEADLQVEALANWVRTPHRHDAKAFVVPLVWRVLPITLSPRSKTHHTLSLVSGDL